MIWVVGIAGQTMNRSYASIDSKKHLAAGWFVNMMPYMDVLYWEDVCCRSDLFIADYSSAKNCKK